jgi:hypothetical protein
MTGTQDFDPQLPSGRLRPPPVYIVTTMPLVSHVGPPVSR